MPSIIKFSGHRDDSLLVNEDVDRVATLIREGGGVIRLTRNIGTPVFVNAERVAYWHDYARTRPAFDSRRADAAPAAR